MKSTAKYMFDEDFATGAKPTMTVVEAERRRADAEAVAHRQGFAAGLAQAQGESQPAHRHRACPDRDGLSRLDHALTGIEARLETEASRWPSRSPPKLAPQLIAREPFAEISALANECFPPAGDDAAFRGAHRRRHLRDGERSDRGNRARRAVSKGRLA